MSQKASKSSGSTAKPDQNLDVIIRIVKAELKRNFEKGYGKMDPYAMAFLIGRDGRTKELARTKTDWNAHMSPVWNHVCPNQPYDKQSSDVRLEITVYEDDMYGTDDVCGSVSIPVQELLGEVVDREVLGKLKEYPLTLEKEVSGGVWLQASLVVHREPGHNDPEALTHVDPARFESPVQRIGVSGGTAPFFKLVLKQPTAKQSPGYFIGKDLSHATDEIDFYQEMRRLANQSGGLDLIPVLNFCFEYEGVVTLPHAEAKPEEKPKDLLVLRNLFDGCKKLRLLDLKIGQKTADAGWQGKSRIAALRQGIVDGLTNSAAEGFRLEGFDGAIPVLRSMDPLMDFGGAKKEKTQKKAFRIMLQRFAGHECLMHLMDVHQEPADPGDEDKSVLFPEELAEIILSEILVKLNKLSVNCRLVPVPQKWIGSSVALGFDAGQLPARSKPQAEIRRNVRVSIFDWGRSELLSIEKHATLTKKEQQDRSQFWGYYVGGIDRLAFEATRLYWHRFSNTGRWKEIRLTVMDFDSATANDFLGKHTISTFKAEDRKVVNLLTNKNKEVKTKGKETTMTYSLSERIYPDNSRLKSSWRLTLHNANDMPRYDKMLLKGTVDAFVEAIAVAEDGRSYKQHTCVKTNTCDPVWEETLEFPIAREGDVLEAALANISPDMISDAIPLASLLICDDSVKAEKKSRYSSQLFGSSNSNAKVDNISTDDEAMKVYEELLDVAASNFDATFSQQPTAHSQTPSGRLSKAFSTSFDSPQEFSSTGSVGLGSKAVKAMKDQRKLMRSEEMAEAHDLPRGCMRKIENHQSMELSSFPSRRLSLVVPSETSAASLVKSSNGSTEVVEAEPLEVSKAACGKGCQCKCM